MSASGEGGAGGRPRKRQSSPAGNGGPSEKKRSKEAAQLFFSSPGVKLAVSDADMTAVEAGVRRTRSGRILLPKIEEEEIEKEDVLKDREGSREERALHLAKQLKDQVTALVHNDSEGNEDDEDGLSAPHKIIEVIESFEQQIEDERNSTRRCVAFLGENGDGKSFFINQALQVTEVREAEYGLNGIEGFLHAQPKESCESQDSKLRNFLFDTLEGSLDLLQHTPDAEQCNIVFAKLVASRDRHGHYMPERERKEEQEILRKIRFAYRDGAPDSESKRGFMLPSESGGVSTTRIAVKVRKGTVYHLVMRYKTEDDIRAELGEFDWEQLVGLDLDNSDDPDAVNVKYKLEMLLRVAGLDPEEVNYDNVTKPTSRDEVVICDEIKNKLKLGFDLFSGRGRKLLDDRLYVRSHLWKVMQNAGFACILQECIVYVPADVLEGVELLDAPGTGVESPQEQLQLTEALRIADTIIVCMQRNLQDANRLKDHLKSSGVIKKIIENPTGLCPVFLFSALDESKSFSKLNSERAVSSFQKKVQDVDKKNFKGLESLLKATFETMPRRDKLKDMTEAQMLEACMPSLKANVFSSAPLMWASLSLSAGEEDPEGEQISRRRKEELLNGMSRQK